MKIYYKKINFAARSYLKITRLLIVHSFFYWKQLLQTTIEPQNSCDDSNLTDKWRHAIATGPGPGPSFWMNFFSLPSSLHEFFFLAISLAWFFFCFFPLPPPHHFSNGPSLNQYLSTSVWNPLINQSITLFTHGIILLKSGLLKSRAH